MIVRSVLILLMACHLSSAQRIVEEVSAVVDTTPILASDVALAELVMLLPRDPDEPIAAHRSRLLHARIRLEIQYRDLEESGVLYRLDLEVVPVLEAMVNRAGGDEALATRLPEHGLAWADVEQLALRVAAATAYTEQRLRPRVRISFEEIQAAYQELVVEPLREGGHQPPPLTTVRDQLNRVLVERKLNAEIADWLALATERHEVTRFVP